MAKLHHILISAGLLAGAQLAHAQGTADLSIQPTQPAAGTTAPAGTADSTTYGSSSGITGGGIDSAAGASVTTPSDASGASATTGVTGTSGTIGTTDSTSATTTIPAASSGATAAPGAADSGAGSGGLVVGTIIQTSPPTQGQSAAAMSNDPFVQRREARAQARQEYRERRQEARQQYQEDKRAADSLIHQQSGR